MLHFKTSLTIKRWLTFNLLIFLVAISLSRVTFLSNIDGVFLPTVPFFVAFGLPLIYASVIHHGKTNFTWYTVLWGLPTVILSLSFGFSIVTKQIDYPLGIFISNYNLYYIHNNYLEKD